VVLDWARDGADERAERWPAAERRVAVEHMEVAHMAAALCYIRTKKKTQQSGGGWGEGHRVGISLIRRAPGTSAMYTCWLTDKCTGPMFIGYGYVHRF
jgi:hypothetical protein